MRLSLAAAGAAVAVVAYRRRQPEDDLTGEVALVTGSSRGLGLLIATDWNTCFSSATPASKRVKPLQNGSPFASSIRAFASSPLAAAVTSELTPSR
jgi:hypothetical protein